MVRRGGASLLAHRYAVYFRCDTWARLHEGVNGLSLLSTLTRRGVD